MLRSLGFFGHWVKEMGEPPAFAMPMGPVGKTTPVGGEGGPRERLHPLSSLQAAAAETQLGSTLAVHQTCIKKDEHLRLNEYG